MKKIVLLYIFFIIKFNYSNCINSDSIDLYLNLMINILTNFIYEDNSLESITNKLKPFNAETRDIGRDWPIQAHTMVGRKRLANIRYCIETVLQNNIPGDLLEAGVWRGGASIFMKAVLTAYNDKERKVWVCDSFEGLPKPSLKDDLDLSTVKFLSVSLQEVKKNFSKYNLLDNQVKFVKGWFKDTLPNLQINSISVLRLDGDMFESTMDILKNLYDKVSLGGFIIIDDFFRVPHCKKAVMEFRKNKNITSPIINIDNAGIFWKK